MIADKIKNARTILYYIKKNLGIDVKKLHIIVEAA